MAYALTLFTTSFFLILYFLFKKKDRDVYTQTFCDDQYQNACKEYVKSVDDVVDGGSVNNAKFKLKIKYLLFLLNRKKYKGIFDEFCDKPSILKSVLKVDFSPLENLPFANGSPRSVLLAKFMLSHSEYIFTQDRFCTIAEEQNKIHTLTYGEISFMREALLYVLLEKVCFLLESLHTIAKTIKIAQQYVKNNGINQDKKLKSFTKSKLFIDLCMIEAGYTSIDDTKILTNVIDNLYMTYSRVLLSMECVLNFDFSRYFTPLEILDKYTVFSSATENQKHNFLTLFESLCKKENIDQFMYAIRLDKYIKTSTRVHTTVKRIDVFNTFICILSRRKDISMLSAGLTSNFFMSTFFGNKKRKIKSSVTKFADFENTFEPIYKFENVNFGISTKNGILQINPHLPKQIESATVVFSYHNVNHTLHLLRSNSHGIFLGDTKIEGTHFIRLGNKPLDIVVKINE